MTPEYENLLSAIAKVSKQNFPDSVSAPENVVLELNGKFSIDGKNYGVTFNFDDETGEFTTDGQLDTLAVDEAEVAESGVAESEAEPVDGVAETEIPNLETKPDEAKAEIPVKAMDAAVSKVEPETAVNAEPDMESRIVGVEKAMSELKAMCESTMPKKPEASKAETETENSDLATEVETEKSEAVAEIVIEDESVVETELVVDEVLETEAVAETTLEVESSKAVKTTKKGWGDEYKF